MTRLKKAGRSHGDPPVFPFFNVRGCHSESAALRGRTIPARTTAPDARTNGETGLNAEGSGISMPRLGDSSEPSRLLRMTRRGTCRIPGAAEPNDEHSLPAIVKPVT